MRIPPIERDARNQCLHLQGEEGAATLPAAPSMMTADDIAAFLQVSTRTVWRLTSSRSLPKPLRIGRTVRWRRSDIEDWIASELGE